MTHRDSDNMMPRLTGRLRRLSSKFRLLTHRFMTEIRRASTALDALTVAASLALLAALVVYTGYEHNAHDLHLLRSAIRFIQIVFLGHIIFDAIFQPRAHPDGKRIVKTAVEAAVLVTLLPLLYPRPEHPWIPWLDALLYSRRFLYPVLASYAIITVSEAVMRLVGRRTNPSLLLSMSFLVLIFIGSLLLMLPRCTYGSLSYPDALFVSTSAVCITGLTPVDVYVTFTPLGIMVLAVLIQVGGLGLMTFTSFFALFFSGRHSIYSQLMLKDMIYSKSMSALIPTLLYILVFTLVLEAIGAVFVFISIDSTLGLPFADTAALAAFHSLSSFCNAGFSTIPGGLSNPLLLDGNISVYWVTSAIVVCGSIGFPILVNFKDALVIHARRLWRRLHRKRDSDPLNIHPYSMNTKIVLVTFFILFFAGAAAILVMEWNNTFAGMSAGEKVTQAVFNSVTARSAGFASVNPAGFLNITLVLVMFLMWVGGAAQSTAGGIKVNTLAALMLNLRCIVTGREKVTAFGRTIAVWSIRRANAVVAISILSYLLFSLVIMALEPELRARDLLFETLSALFTIGSSLGITPELSTPSKLVLCLAMFLGRVGIISLLTGFAGQRHNAPADYPTDNLIIN